MRELLSLVPKPSRYLGIEEGSVFKSRSAVSLHVGLAFPDMYEVGMSYLGQKILYMAINEREDYWAERVFTPCLETAKVLREHDALLSTLESDTALNALDMLGFHVTHEMCYTNVLYMLDLGGIPLRATERGDSLDEYPVVLAGGGCTMSAEPLAPFMDLMILGEGEDVQLELCDLLKACKQEKTSRSEFLRRASGIAGVYVPSLFESHGPKTLSTPVAEIPRTPTRRVVPDMDDAYFPTSHPIPFGAVHNRLALEIGRGCTRGCRFCQAGIIYRPARERSVEKLEQLLEDGLKETGYDDISFLSLSTGDYSALKTLFTSTVDRCSAEQISVSLPSLRVGSIDDDIMARMAGIRRTGATLAPEAGSQRLRDVINKGVTEEQILMHVRKLFQHGWQQVKLYFMIGLPTETYEDLDAILELCRKVRDAAGGSRVKRLQVTAAISPFVPKPHTPFQWERQITMDEIRDRIGYLKDAFRQQKSIRMRWHEPVMSTLEGIFSRGDRRLADVVETAYRKGAVFSSWVEHLSIDPYMEAMAEHGLDISEYNRERDEDEPLPWDHINTGITKDFLRKERHRALEMKLTEDCRYGACRVCGVCDKGKGLSTLERLEDETTYENITVFKERDQQAHEPELDERGEVVRHDVPNKPPKLPPELVVKAGHYRIWYTKKDAAVFLSQLELQSLFERMMRKACLPLAFSQGFHPLPLISFGRALPVGVASECEWMNVFLREEMTPEEIFRSLVGAFPRGMQPVKVERISQSKKQPQAVAEEFLLTFTGDEQKWATFKKTMEAFRQEESRMWTRQTKKGERTSDIRPLFQTIEVTGEREMRITYDWSRQYMSPINLISAIVPEAGLLDFSLLKTAQHLDTAENPGGWQ